MRSDACAPSPPLLPLTSPALFCNPRSHLLFFLPTAPLCAHYTTIVRLGCARAGFVAKAKAEVASHDSSEVKMRTRIDEVVPKLLAAILEKKREDAEAG